MGERAARIDVANFGARVRAAHVGCVGNAGEREIIDKMAPLG
jgi:hypothetical protein